MPHDNDAWMDALTHRWDSVDDDQAPIQTPAPARNRRTVTAIVCPYCGTTEVHPRTRRGKSIRFRCGLCSLWFVERIAGYRVAYYPDP